MRIRALMVILLLSAQPLAAVASVWTAAAIDDSAGHCESMPGSINDLLTDSAITESSVTEGSGSCIEKCSACVVCMAVLQDYSTDTIEIAALPVTDRMAAQVPSGIRDILYRPPIRR